MSAQAAGQRGRLEIALAAIDARLHAGTKARITRQYQTLFNGVAATVSSEAIGEILLLPDVIAVHDDVEVHACVTDGVTMIGAPAIWQTYGVTGAGVKVAVLDSGIDYTHPDLGGCFGAGCKVGGGYDFVNNDGDPRDDHGHGTHVAGIIAANGSLKGVAPGASLLAYKVLDVNGYGLTSGIIAGLERAVLDGAKIANLSLSGAGNPDDPLSQAIDNATAAGMLCVVAAGNAGPRDRTVGSPGVARTALTVGAVTGAGDVASFSSRGYVSNGGGQFAMKPEIVAPGVSIRSTVPFSAPLGDPTGYREVSGTSMATPHVAGSAALLLEWKAEQTPADLRNRLAGSASGGAMPFSKGAGLVDLVPAFGLRILASQTHVPMGVATGTSGVASFQKTFSVRNTTATAQTLFLTAGSVPPPGTTLDITPSSITLQAGASATVSLQLSVDQAVTPAPAEPLAWSNTIAITTSGQTTSVPVYFFKGSLLNLAFGESPQSVFLLNPQLHTARSFGNPGASLSDVVQPGAWDIWVVYGGVPYPIVIREQQDVSGNVSLNLARTEATKAVTIRAVNHAGQSLQNVATNALLVIALENPDIPSGAAESWLTVAWGVNDFRISPLSSRYHAGTIGRVSDDAGPNTYIYSWSGIGISSDVILPVPGLAVRRLDQSVALPPGAHSGLFKSRVGYAIRSTLGGLGEYGPPYMQYTGFSPAILNETVYSQSTAAPGSMLLMSSFPHLNANALGVPRDFVNGQFMRTEGNEIVLDDSPFFFLLDPPRLPTAVLGANVHRWDLDLAPSIMQIQFRNNSSKLYANSRFCTELNVGWICDYPTWWLTHTGARIEKASAVVPEFSLYRGGAPVGNYAIDKLHYGISSPAGMHEIRSTSPAYRIGNVSGFSKFVAAFDTSRSDPNPPSVTRFRIEQNGLRTATPVRPSAFATAVKFRATDDTALVSVVLQWRTSGTTIWNPMPLTADGNEYTAPFQYDGAIDLRLTAADASGNTFEEEWTPAVITTAPVPPRITNINPASGPTTGGQTVTITGTNLSGVTVTIGGSSATVTSSSATTATFTTPARIAGVVNVAVASAAGAATLPGGYTYVAQVPPHPAAVSATAASTSAVNVFWSAVASADSYQIFRNSSLIATVLSGLSFHDSPLSPGTAYLYKVRAVTSGLVSPDSVTDLATTLMFSNDPLVANQVAVKASHLIELRAAVDAVRARAGLPAATWTDPSPAGIRFKPVHITELRTALGSARSALGLSPSSYARTLLTGTHCEALDFMEIRDGVR